MARNKGKRSSGAGIEGPAEQNKPAAISDENFLSFDASTLANLTKNIEQKLQGGGGANKNSKNKLNISPNTTNTKKKPTGSQQAGSEQKAIKGKKRHRNGDVIAREEKDGKIKSSKSKGDNEDEILRQEILALGGSKEDFDLLAGVDSEAEEEGSGVKDQPDEAFLRKELARFLKDAGQFEPEIVEGEEPENDESEEAEDGGVEVEDVEESIEDFEDSPPSSPTQPKEKLKQKSAPKEALDQKQEQVFPKGYSRLTVSPRADWFNVPLPSISTSKTTTGLPRYLLDRIHQHAKSLLEEENKTYTEIQQSSSSHKFYSTIATSGTLSDKISALTLAVQESPLHNIKALENLVGLSKKRSRAQAVEVLGSLKDMFAQGTLLPGDRKLKTFANQSSLMAAFQGAGNKWTGGDPLPGGLQPGHLIMWAFEDYLKGQFFEVLKVLETWCNDEIEFSRSRAVSYVYELLKEKPEQEANLLRLLVNKLGDPGKKIASRASYLLLQLGQTHPLMKSTIITHVEEFLFRPGQSMHAKYYAVITLNQTVLSSKEEKVAIQLLDIYFPLFVTLLKPTKNENTKPNPKKQSKLGKGKNKDTKAAKTEEHDDQLREKLVSAVLTGVNRAYPFTSSDTKRLSDHIETLFHITHSSNFNTSIQALMLIQQLTATHQVAADRFYRTLYESLLDPRVATSSKQSLYLNLSFRALKNDLNVKRVKAFVKRLIQILGLHQPSFICGVFFLIRELEKTFPALQSLVDQREEYESDEEEVFRDVLDKDDVQPRTEIAQGIDDTRTRKRLNGYDPRKRDPQHSNADQSCLWELLPLLNHFHPSVSVSAAHLISHEPLTGKPDLTIHTLTHFLDRFVYRNPKASATLRGSSLMQPLASGDSHGLLVATGGLSGKGRLQQPVNSEAFWRQRAEEVAAEDVFFHEYFNRLGKDKKTRKAKKAEKDPVTRHEEAGEGESDNESEIWKALVDSRPGLEGDDDSDADHDMNDLESAFDDDRDLEDGDDEDEVIFNDESDDEAGQDGMDEGDEGTIEASAAKKANGKFSDEDEDDFDMDVSDDEAFRDSDEDLPSDFEVGGVDIPEVTTVTDNQSERKKRQKLRHLPLFASVDDYAALLANEDDAV